MKTKSNHTALRLRPIPTNTAVHTPTEAEANELLAILHENGYEWYHKYAPIPNPNLSQVQYIYIYQSLHGCKNVITYCDRRPFEKFFTLAEFKRLYCEGEKPQPKFEVGDKVVVVNADYGLKDAAGDACEISEIRPHGYYIKSQTGEWFAKESDLEPYNEPETKDETKDEAKEEAKGETKELNLFEILEDYEQKMYSPVFGDTDILQKYPERDEICIASYKAHENWVMIDKYGKVDRYGDCILWPSKTLYEQYPLDPQKAWMKWQEKKQFRILRITLTAPDLERNYVEMDIPTSADRDKCIEEIKAIIEKYSKK